MRIKIGQQGKIGKAFGSGGRSCISVAMVGCQRVVALLCKRIWLKQWVLDRSGQLYNGRDVTSRWGTAGLKD